MRLLHTVWDCIVCPVIDFIYPARCLGCDMPVRAVDVLCSTCLASLDLLPVSRSQARATLAGLNRPVEARMALAMFGYESDSSIARCIEVMKYRGLERIAIWLGRLAGERLMGTPLLDDAPVLVPVPLHTMKRRERGYNQAEEICRGIAQETGLDLAATALIRVRATVSQSAAHLNRLDRATNVRNAFRARVPDIEGLRGRPVLLVDDLLTTGATLGACAEALLDAGIVDVRIFAIARPDAL
jgi:ComF family protein